MSIKFENASLVTEKGLKKGDCVLQDGKINLSGTKASCDKTIDLAGKYVVPGFVDIHFHGYNLFDFSSGIYDQKTESFDDSEEAFLKGLKMLSTGLPQFGVTGFYVATVAESVETLRTCYSHLGKYLKKQTQSPAGAKVLGGLLEGSFISPDMAGAQNPEFVLKPSKEAFDKIQDGGTIKLVLVGPDSGEPAIQLTKYLTDKGIVIGFGHTNATYNQVAEAIKAGLKYCIHFTNGPTGGSYKPFNGGGAVEAVLKFDELYAELIADGFHVNPLYIRDIIKRKGVDKIIGMTDCQFVAGSAIKTFTLGGTPGMVSEDGSHLRVANKKNTLFGSNLTMNRGFTNMLNWLTSEMDGIWNRRHEALKFEDALTAVTKFYSTNPCKVTGLAKAGCGTIADGAKADLCVLDISGSQGKYKVQVEKTFVEGNIVYSKS
jgi:N-acetylglucosamine-6-phosphate deacetylase